MRKIDAHIRRRLRAIILRHWKRRRTIARTSSRSASTGTPCGGSSTQGRRSWWALSHAHVVDQGLRNAYFAKRGLIFVVDMHRSAHQQIAVPEPPQLALWG